MLTETIKPVTQCDNFRYKNTSFLHLYDETGEALYIGKPNGWILCHELFVSKEEVVLAIEAWKARKAERSLQ